MDVEPVEDDYCFMNSFDLLWERFGVFFFFFRQKGGRGRPSVTDSLWA